jgi:hypothetical protein
MTGAASKREVCRGARGSIEGQSRRPPRVNYVGRAAGKAVRACVHACVCAYPVVLHALVGAGEDLVPPVLPQRLAAVPRPRLRVPLAPQPRRLVRRHAAHRGPLVPLLGGGAVGAQQPLRLRLDRLLGQLLLLLLLFIFLALLLLLVVRLVALLGLVRVVLGLVLRRLALLLLRAGGRSETALRHSPHAPRRECGGTAAIRCFAV